MGLNQLGNKSLAAAASPPVSRGTWWSAARHQEPGPVRQTLAAWASGSTARVRPPRATMYLIDATTVTGHMLYVDGDTHFGRW